MNFIMEISVAQCLQANSARISLTVFYQTLLGQSNFFKIIGAWLALMLNAIAGLPDFAEVYSFIGSVFDPDTKGHVRKLKEMDPINFETVKFNPITVTIYAS